LISKIYIETNLSSYFVSLIYNDYNKNYSFEKKPIKEYKKRKYYPYSKHNENITYKTTHCGIIRIDEDKSDILIENYFFKTKQEMNEFVLALKFIL
jgi:hypothetical protein